MQDAAIDFNRWHDAARARRSVRKFSEAPEEWQLQRLRMLTSALNGDGVRIELLEATPALFSGLMARGIKNAGCAAAVVTGPDAVLARAGFKGEALVLECTAMGLGTCWLGASFNKKEARRLSKLGEGETLRALIAIGKPEQPLTEVSEAERKRKPLAKMVITTGGVSLADMEQWQNTALKCARIAPSAMNFQPWRFAFAPGHICMVAAGMFGPGIQLDIGIAMLHIELGAAMHGVRGAWTRDVPEKDKPKKSEDGADAVWVFFRLPDGE